MLKSDLRLKYSALRKDLSHQSLLNSSLTIAKKLLELPIWSYNYYHVFLPIYDKSEIDTSFIISLLKGKKKKILVPKVTAKNSLQHYILSNSTKLEKSKWGVPEPVGGKTMNASKIDVVFVPLLSFDELGNRVGYGKGFYDNFLAQCKNEVVKIGLSLFSAERVITDVSEKDIPLNYCVTPEKIYSFSRT